MEQDFEKGLLSDQLEHRRERKKEVIESPISLQTPKGLRIRIIINQMHSVLLLLDFFKLSSIDA